jgi:membrane-associated protease RseP (regulator of RpoE activity)
MFFITLTSVFLVYGFQWTSGNPLTSIDIALESAQFALGLMFILLFHELGHYFVAKYHKFSLSVPYFLPFPFAFGTLGAVIHLRSLPKSRTALLEMGAAGPIVGFFATCICFLIDIGSTINYDRPRLAGTKEETAKVLTEISNIEPSSIELFFQKIGMISPVSADAIELMILSDPILLECSSLIFLGEVLNPYAQLGPWSFAGWVGCMITAINLLPIGQLDGGHIANALFPDKARQISLVTLTCVIGLGYFWMGWVFWGLLIYFLGAYASIEVPVDSELKSRSKWIALVALIVFLLCVMLRPIYIDTVPLDLVDWIQE